MTEIAEDLLRYSQNNYESKGVTETAMAMKEE
jgi:hypothetical protein